MALDVGSITSGFTSGVGGNPITGFLQFILPLIIVLGGGYYILKYLRYNIKINIFNPIERGSLKDYDKGLILTDKKSGVKSFKLLKFKKDWLGGIIPTEFFVPVKKAFSRIGYELYMIRDDEGRLRPIMPPGRDNIPAWDGFNNSDMVWAQQEYAEGIQAFTERDKWGVFLDRAMPYIGIAIIFVMALVLFKQMEGVSEALGGVARALTDAAGTASIQGQVIQ